jgi:hypothetical protein
MPRGHYLTEAVKDAIWVLGQPAKASFSAAAEMFVL